MPGIRVEKRQGETRRAVLKGLRAFNDGFLPKNRKSRPLTLSVREGDTILGGLVGKSFADWLFVELLWVDEHYRSGGFGRKLMIMAEDEGRKRGVRTIYLDTFSVQAPDFYKKLGYREFGRLDNHIGRHSRYWLAKDL